MSNTTAQTTARSGIGFLGLLTIVLVILKAMGYLNISWFLVFLPIAIPFIVGVIILIGIGLLYLFLLLASMYDERKRKRLLRKRHEELNNEQRDAIRERFDNR